MWITSYKNTRRIISQYNAKKKISSMWLHWENGLCSFLPNIKNYLSSIVLSTKRRTIFFVKSWPYCPKYYSSILQNILWSIPWCNNVPHTVKRIFTLNVILNVPLSTNIYYWLSLWKKILIESADPLIYWVNPRCLNSNLTQVEQIFFHLWQGLTVGVVLNCINSLILAIL